MRPLPNALINTPCIEAWPAHLLKARGNRDARRLAQVRHVLRRKRDGRYLATFDDAGLQPLVPALRSEPGLEQALRALDAASRSGHAAVLPLAGLQQRLGRLGIDDAYADRTGLALVAEPVRLDFAGLDRYQRPLWLLAPAAKAWLRLREAARRDDVAIEAISGYRSHDYQLGIFERKLARGLALADILTVNAAPGYSEHHSGRALDIGAPGEPPAEEGFEATPAFDWLQRNAAGFGFAMSYPRDNPHGIVYEPWHWAYTGPHS
jgi:D-alanyl-D-alanine carboxypeptidase